MFTTKEKEYIKAQGLARLGTVDDDGQVDVSPVGFEFDGEVFYMGGRQHLSTRKHKNVVAGHIKVAIAIDDVVSHDPYTPRGLKIHAIAEVIEREGDFYKGTQLKITPTVHWSWGIEGAAFADGKFIVNKVVR